MSHPDPCSVVRIAIALVVLKHKPRDRTIASYLIDLQSHFPVATKNKDSRDWRTYALELEKQLTAVKAQHDADQELLSRLRANDSTSDAPPPKKRSKKNPTKDQHEPERTWDQSRADGWCFLSSQYPSSPSLVAAYTSLKGALASPNTDLLTCTSRITDAIARTLDTIHLFLFSPPNPTPDLDIPTPLSAPMHLKPEHIDSGRIALTFPLLMHILQIALPALVQTAHDSTLAKRSHLRARARATTSTSVDVHAHVDKILDRVLECLLLPLLRAFVPLCSARLAPLLAVPPRKDKDKVGRSAGRAKNEDKGFESVVCPSNQTDARTDVFSLLRASLEALNALPPRVLPVVGMNGADRIANGIRDRLGLETIREIERLYAVPSQPASPLPSALQPTSQLPHTPSEPLSLPTTAPTPPSAPSQTHAPSQPQRRPEPLGKRLEKLAGTRADRVRALVIKDAGWFLASTLHLCISPALAGAPGDVSGVVGGRPERAGALLREALVERIGKLLVAMASSGDSVEDHATCHAAGSRVAIDPVCQNMLLAVCERALSQLPSP